MRSELYKKMNDDERLQYICNLENVKDSLSDTKTMQDQIIELHKRLLSCTEQYADCEEQRRYAYERYNYFKEEMLEKYDTYPTSTCECKEIEND